MELFDRLSPSYWWSDPGTTIGGPLAIGAAAFLAVVLVAAVAAWILAPRLATENRVLQRFVARCAKWTVAFAVVGLLLLLFRWQIVPFFSKRLWTFLWLAGAAASVGYAGYYLRRVYPIRLAAWQESERRRRYLPRPGQGGGRSRGRARRRR